MCGMRGSPYQIDRIDLGVSQFLARMVNMTAARTIAGIQIHTSSLRITAHPFAEKKRARPIGETWIGRKGKKIRRLSNGAKNATPRPPFVMASSVPCEAAARKR